MTSAIECSMGVSVVKGEGRRRPREARSRLVNFELFGYILPNEKVAVKEF